MVRRSFETFNMNTINTDGLSIGQISHHHYKFFIRKDYHWWYDVLPDDVVVDIGSCVGFFSMQALDFGASKVYMVEPSRSMMRTAMNNVFDYTVMKNADDQKVIPVMYAIGDPEKDYHVYGDSRRGFAKEKYETVSFMDFVRKFNIDYIDYLKINADGAEYDILNEENYDFLSNNVRHIAIQFHLRTSPDAVQKFIHCRDTILQRFSDKGKVRFQDLKFERGANNTSEILAKNWNAVEPEFMIYITDY